jgi:hypothetical protein
LGTGDGVKPVWLHPAANDANTIARQNPTLGLNAEADKNRTLHPLHFGDGFIPFSRFRPFGASGPIQIHVPMTRMDQMRR